MAMMPSLPSLRELFGVPAPQAPMSPAQTAAAAAQQQPTGQTAAGTNPTVPSETTLRSDGAVTAIPATPTGDTSPLDNYKKIWETPSAAPSSSQIVPTITADPAQMLAAAKTVDFTKSMSAEALDRASKGDASALAQIINEAAQAGYAQAAGATVNIVKSALTQQAEKFRTEYEPARQRSNAVDSLVSERVSLASDPAAAPIVSALKQQLSASFPTATPAEIATHVENYLQEFSNKVVTANGGRIQSKEDLAPRGGPLRREEQDWSVFFSEPSSPPY